MPKEVDPFEKQGALQRIEPRVRTPRIPNADNPAPCRRGKKGMSIYFDVDTHRMLHQLSLEQDKPVSGLVLEGVNLMLCQYGRKPTA